MYTRRPKLALVGLLGLLAFASASYGGILPLVDPNAPLTGAEPYGLFHPGIPAGGQPTFNLYGGTALDAPATPVAELLTVFGPTDGISGTVNSRVFDMGGSYLFVYTFALDSGSVDVSNGNMAGYDGVVITDAGLVTSSSTYAAGDLAQMFRSGDTLGFAWKYLAAGVLPPVGTPTTSFYVMTDATTYGQSTAALISPNATSVIQDIAVLVPVPEPTTMVLLAAGAVTAIVRRRRR